MPHIFEKRCEARQNEIRDGSVLEHVTKRIAVITPHRALVVLRFLLNSPQETLRFRPKSTALCHLTAYIRSAETDETCGSGMHSLRLAQGLNGQITQLRLFLGGQHTKHVVIVFNGEVLQFPMDLMQLMDRFDHLRRIRIVGPQDLR